MSTVDPNAPIDVSKPKWRCPHCGNDYYDDLERATACGALGPAEIPATPDCIVLTTARKPGERRPTSILAKLTVSDQTERSGGRHVRKVRLAQGDLEVGVDDDWLAELSADDRPTDVLRFDPGLTLTPDYGSNYGMTETASAVTILSDLYSLGVERCFGQYARSDRDVTWWRAPQTDDEIAADEHLGTVTVDYARTKAALEKFVEFGGFAPTGRGNPSWWTSNSGFTSVPVWWGFVLDWVGFHFAVEIGDTPRLARITITNFDQIVAEILADLDLFLAGDSDVRLPAVGRVSSGPPSSKGAPGKRRMELFSRLGLVDDDFEIGSKGKTDDWRIIGYRFRDILSSTESQPAARYHSTKPVEPPAVKVNSLD